MTLSLVKPSGSFEFVCPVSGQHVNSHRATVIKMTDWLNSKTAKGDLKVVLGNLPEDATDAAYEKAWREAGKNQAQALEALGWVKADKKAEPEKKADADADKKAEPAPTGEKK